MELLADNEADAGRTPDDGHRKSEGSGDDFDG
jgi:hypothetical protein